MKARAHGSTRHHAHSSVRHLCQRSDIRWMLAATELARAACWHKTSQKRVTWGWGRPAACARHDSVGGAASRRRSVVYLGQQLHSSLWAQLPEPPCLLTHEDTTHRERAVLNLMYPPQPGNHLTTRPLSIKVTTGRLHALWAHLKALWIRVRRSESGSGSPPWWDHFVVHFHNVINLPFPAISLCCEFRPQKEGGNGGQRRQKITLNSIVRVSGTMS